MKSETGNTISNFNFYSQAFKILSKQVICALVMMGVVYYVREMLNPGFILMFLLVLLGVIVYFVPMWFLDKDIKWDAQEALSVLREKIPFLRKH